MSEERVLLADYARMVRRKRRLRNWALAAPVLLAACVAAVALVRWMIINHPYWTAAIGVLGLFVCASVVLARFPQAQPVANHPPATTAKGARPKRKGRSRGRRMNRNSLTRTGVYKRRKR